MLDRSNQHEHQVVKCRSCGAPIVWMKTRNDKNIPVDPDNVDPGDTVFDSRSHKSHFATCPNATQHRRPR